ncbi:hypothetical protein FQN54_004639 [Arachnomyces sp. PD_36]|nr:hypothetical protein FQN54_004639 [Arachnomyces sp. PD_36]
MAPRINIPPVTRILLILLIALSFLYNLARWRAIDAMTPAMQAARTEPPIIPYLTLVPSKVLYYPWTLLTATFVEQNIFTVLINGATLFYGGKYLERAWGSREFGKFIIAVSLIPNVIAVLVYISWSALQRGSGTSRSYVPPFPKILRYNLLIIRNSSLTAICGGISVQASFLVAFKQLVPEHTVTILKGIIKMRVKHFPALFLLLNAIGGIVFGTHTAAILSWLGILTSWTYLRFYKRQPDLSGTSTSELGIKGDASETFAFAYFFPDTLQPPIAFVSDRIYNVLVSLRICTPFSAEDVASGNEQAMARGEAGLPNLLQNGGRVGGGAARAMGKREEAERRRAIALKALDQRLQAATAGRSQPRSTTSPSPQPHSQPQSQPVAPAISQGQSMLGETNYTPDNS